MTTLDRSGLPTCGDAGGISKRGTPCRVYMNLGAAGLCLMHDPARVEEARASHVAGSHGRSAALRKAKAVLPEDCPKAPKTVADAEKFASWLTFAVVSGQIDARTAHEAALCLREFRSANSVRVLESEVKTLRRELAEAKDAAKRQGRTA
jgi:hypothetical protein